MTCKDVGWLHETAELLNHQALVCWKPKVQGLSRWVSQLPHKQRTKQHLAPKAIPDHPQRH